MPAAPATTDDAVSTSPKGYTAINSSLLRLIDQIEIDLFVMPAGAEFPLLLREAGFQVTQEQIGELIDDRTKLVLVRESDYANFSKKLLSSLDAVVEDESIAPQDRFHLVQTAAAAEVEHACSLLQPGKYIDLAEKLGDNFATLIATSDFMPADLFAVARHDYHTFSHVTNVSCYVGMLAEAMGITDDEQRRQIAVGGMLHDLGKRHIPAKILQKPGRLDNAERRVIEEHPLTGYVELVERDDLSHGQLMMVYQHHEKIAGGGYPVGVTAEEIHPWAKMTAVVDIFDAVTGSRPYRDPMPKSRALELLSDLAGGSLDPELVKCFASLMQTT